jgi:aminocarboxymuconate-semialdehyde decarboxylase
MDTIALDVHAHLIPVREAALHTFAGLAWDEATQAFAVDGHGVGLKGLFNAPSLLAWMTENKVAHAWVSAPPPVYRPGLPADEAERWARALNAGLFAIAAAHVDKLSPLFHLPVEHPAVAAALARDWIAQGHKRFAMAAGGQRLVLSGPAFDPLWRTLDGAAAFLFLHPGEGCDSRHDPFYLQNLIGNPSETGTAAAHLVFSGIPERYADIQFCLAHAGGTTAAVAGRWERGFATSRPGLDTTRERPGRALKRFCVDCIAHDPAALRLAAEVFGADRIVFGSDWPFPMGLPKPHEQLAGVDPALRRAIVCDNPKRLMGEP